jgi:hypothetical protein
MSPKTEFRPRKRKIFVIFSILFSFFIIFFMFLCISKTTQDSNVSAIFCFFEQFKRTKNKRFEKSSIAPLPDIFQFGWNCWFCAFFFFFVHLNISYIFLLKTKITKKRKTSVRKNVDLCTIRIYLRYV